MANQSKAWICCVCGHIHYGDAPPECCVLCGAGPDLFEPYQESQAEVPEVVTQWRCLICDYVAEGSEPPEVCPVCGAPADQFEVYHAEAPAAAATEGNTQTYVIVGAGIAGLSAVEAISKSSANAKIVVLSKEDELPYYRLNLTRYLAGEIQAEHLPLHPESWYNEQGIDLRLGVELCSVVREQKTVTLRDGDTLNYDKLILAMGSHPFVPPIPGANRENVTVLRTKQDADHILAQAGPEARIVVLGGGLLGLEAAGALVDKAASVTVLEGFGWLLPRQLTQNAAQPVENHVRGLGIQLRLGARVKELVGDERVHGVLLDDDELIPADLVILSTGVRPNSYVARLVELEVHGGIVVNNHMQTSDPDIYAAGDVAEHQGTLYGIWGPAQFQGATAGQHAAGAESEFLGVPRSNMLKVLGYDLFSIGQITAEDGSYQMIEGTVDGHYQSYVFHDGCMVGGILLGDTTQSAHVKHAVEQKRDCSVLLQGERCVAKVLDFLKTQPD